LLTGPQKKRIEEERKEDRIQRRQVRELRTGNRRRTEGQQKKKKKRGRRRKVTGMTTNQRR